MRVVSAARFARICISKPRVFDLHMVYAEKAASTFTKYAFDESILCESASYCMKGFHAIWCRCHQSCKSQTHALRSWACFPFLSDENQHMIVFRLIRSRPIEYILLERVRTLKFLYVYNILQYNSYFLQIREKPPMKILLVPAKCYFSAYTFANNRGVLGRMVKYNI